MISRWSILALRFDWEQTSIALPCLRGQNILGVSHTMLLSQTGAAWLSVFRQYYRRGRKVDNAQVLGLIALAE